MLKSYEIENHFRSTLFCLECNLRGKQLSRYVIYILQICRILTYMTHDKVIPYLTWMMFDHILIIINHAWLVGHKSEPCRPFAHRSIRIRPVDVIDTLAVQVNASPVPFRTPVICIVGVSREIGQFVYGNCIEYIIISIIGDI